MRASRALPLMLVCLLAGGLVWFVAFADAPTPDAPALDVAPIEQGDPTDPGVRGADGIDDPVRDADPGDASDTPRSRTRAGITGEVVDARGGALRDAAITARPVDPASLRGAPHADGAVLASTRSERDGSFTLEAVPAGRWLRVSAALPGYATVGRLVPSAGAYVRLVLPAAGGLALAVVHPDDAPVPEADVQVRSGESVFQATTDAEGKVEFPALPPGSARVHVRRIDAGSTRAGPFLVRAGETTAATVLVARGIALEGTVVDDATGAPVANAQVRVARPALAAEATTDAEGRFGPLPGGGLGERVLVAVTADGRAPILEPVHLRMPGTQSVLLRLRESAPWTGRVLDGDGRPVAGAEVGYTSDGIAVALRGGRTTTDDQGAFTLPPPPVPAPGRRVVLVARAGDALGAVALRPDQVPPAPLDVTVLRGATVTGRIVDSEGQGLAGVGVRLTPAWSEVPRAARPSPATSRLHAFNAVGNEGLATATAADGSWRLDGVPAGTFQLRLRRDGVLHAREERILVDARGGDGGTVVLDAGHELRGEVVDARGTAVAGAVVNVQPASGGPRQRTTTDADGAFAVPGLRAGTYTVRALIAGRSGDAHTVRIGPDEDNPIRYVLAEPAVLELRVLAGERPYSGLLTVAFGEPGSGRATARRHTLRASAGKAVLEDAPPGAWTLEAFAPGDLRGQVEDVALDAGRRSTVQVVLAAGATLAGTVRTAGGRAVASAQLDLQHPSTGGRVFATSDADGRYRVTGLAAGDWTLRIRGRGGAPVEEQLVLGTGEARALDPTLAPAGSLRVRAVDAGGASLVEALVGFRGADGRAVRTRKPPRTGRDGSLLQHDLPLGPITVLVRTADGRRGVANAIVVAGTPRDVTVPVPSAPR